MKIIKKIFLTILLLIAVGILFRGWIYRNSVTYHSNGQRTNYPVSEENLAEYIEEGSKNLKKTEIQEIIKVGLSITSKQLDFTTGINHNDPNLLVTSKTANCVGYAQFFSTSCSYLLEKYELSQDWIAKPQIGQLYFLGVNVHNYLNSPFFKDHDFVIIENKTTGEVFAVDPTVHDYLKISLVSYRK